MKITTPNVLHLYFLYLKRLQKKVNFFILHENPDSINKLLKRIDTHKMTNDIFTKKFDEDSVFL